MRLTTCWQRRKTALFVVPLICGIAATILVAAIFADTDVVADEAYIPDNDFVVLVLRDERHADTALIQQRHALSRAPTDPLIASEYAAAALGDYARTADARYLGFADGALQPWADDPAPPESIWLLRGRILQTQHQFRAAAADLEAFLAVHTRSVEGALLAADAWRRAGDIARARSRCVGIALRGRPDLAAFCAADIYLSLDAPDMAVAALRQAESRSAETDLQTEQWQLAVAADVAAAAGRHEHAIALYETARALPGATIALHVSLADLLLEQHRPHDALNVLSELPDADAVLLRRAMAMKALGRTDFRALAASLQDRFETEALVGDDGLHDRERAMLALHVNADPDTALAFARANWQRQKGREDGEILLQAASAAGQPDAAADVIRWRQQFLPEKG